MIETAKGSVNLPDAVTISDEMARKNIEQMERATAEIKAKMSGPGGLALPDLLDQRRMNYGIPDGAFRVQSVYERCLIFQISPMSSETEKFGDTLIIKPDVTKDRERVESPRGILVSAGLRAMDILESNGIQLGHIVTFIKFSPYRIPVDCIGGKWMYLMQVDAGDITGDEDLGVELRAGRRRLLFDDSSGEHYIEGTKNRPMAPHVSTDL